MCPRSSSFASPGWRSFRTCFWKLLCRSSDSLLWIWFDGDVSRSRLKMAQQSSKGQEFWSVEAAQPRFFVASPLNFSPSIWEILVIGHPCGWCRFTRLCGQCVSNPSSIPQVSDESFGPIDQLLWSVAWNLGLGGSRRPPKQSFSEAAVGSQWFSTMHEISWMPDGWPEKLKYLAARLSTCQWRFWRQTKKHHLLKILNFDGWPTIFVFPFFLWDI